MARRKTTKRVDSEEVQGEGSYVVLRRLTVEETAERMDLIDAREIAERKAEAGEKLTGGERELIDEPSGARYRETIRYYGDHIIAWDWADENENPLPLPSDDASVVDGLTNDEAAFLARVLAGGSEEEEKN